MNTKTSSSAANGGPGDERLAKVSLTKTLLQRPEVGAIVGLIAVIIFFSVYADSRMFSLSGIMNFMEPAAQLGILAIAAALLMVGGEFDLSIGSMIAFAGIALGIPLVLWGWPLSLSILFAFGTAVCHRRYQWFYCAAFRFALIYCDAGFPVYSARPDVGWFERSDRYYTATGRAGSGWR